MNATKSRGRRPGPRGLGGVRQRPDGRWEARLSLPYGGTKSAYRRSEADALAALADLVAERDHPVTTGRQSAMTFRTWSERWVADADLAQGSRRSYRASLSAHINPVIGSTPVAKLTQADVLAMLARMEARGASASTRAYALRLTRNVLGRAMQTTPPMVRANVALTVPTPRVERFEVRPPTDPELVAILHQARRIRSIDPATYLALRLLADTGMRLGEVLGLGWADVVGDIVTIRASLDSRTHSLSRTKTPKSRRSLRLSPQVAALMDAERRRQVAGGAVSTFVLARPTGREGRGPVGPLDARNVRSAWLRACARSGHPPFRIHDIRHAVATRYLAATDNMAAVSAHLGHARISTTVDTYGHLRASTLDLTRHALDVSDNGDLDTTPEAHIERTF